MYAVIKTGGKQYRVSPGQRLKVEKLAAEVGDTFAISQVLLVCDGENVRVGTPELTDVSVQTKILSHGRHDKVRIFKMRRRKHYQKHQGHRQYYTEIQIENIA